MDDIKKFILEDDFLQVYLTLKNNLQKISLEKILEFINEEEKEFPLNRIYKKYFQELIEKEKNFYKKEMSEELKVENKNNPYALFQNNHIMLGWRDSELSVPGERVKTCIVGQKHVFYDSIKGPIIILEDGKDSRLFMFISEVEKDCAKFAKFLNDLIVLCYDRKIQFSIEKQANLSLED